MGLNLPIETPTGTVRVNPTRDIAYFWSDIVGAIAYGLPEEVWEPWFRWFCELTNTAEDDLRRAHACYFEFMKLALVVDVRSPFTAMNLSGFLDCPPAAQLVVLAKLGQIATGAFWAGIRDAVTQGQDVASISGLASYGKLIKSALFEKFGSTLLDFRKEKP